MGLSAPVLKKSLEGAGAGWEGASVGEICKALEEGDALEKDKPSILTLNTIYNSAGIPGVIKGFQNPKRRTLVGQLMPQFRGEKRCPEPPPKKRKHETHRSSAGNLPQKPRATAL
ncbi:hypothetical protein UY3_07189 [Chelonia mydas]|uniref:Uncharacterized protein n=1 Tax=Chelonia mydas TaxID=8469 RepID=M7BC87_CHEMY|nr:hypothetical protein UY3_07189 [Chelonia mydas]